MTNVVEPSKYSVPSAVFSSRFPVVVEVVAVVGADAGLGCCR